MNKQAMQYIISRISERAFDAREESKKEPDNSFLEGRHLAYYEVLDIIKTELDIRDEDLKDYGLDINLQKDFL